MLKDDSSLHIHLKPFNHENDSHHLPTSSFQIQAGWGFENHLKGQICMELTTCHHSLSTFSSIIDYISMSFTGIGTMFWPHSHPRTSSHNPSSSLYTSIQCQKTSTLPPHSDPFSSSLDPTRFTDRQQHGRSLPSPLPLKNVFLNEPSHSSLKPSSFKNLKETMPLLHLEQQIPLSDSELENLSLSHHDDRFVSKNAKSSTTKTIVIPFTFELPARGLPPSVFHDPKHRVEYNLTAMAISSNGDVLCTCTAPVQVFMPDLAIQRSLSSTSSYSYKSTDPNVAYSYSLKIKKRALIPGSHLLVDFRISSFEEHVDEEHFVEMNLISWCEYRSIKADKKCIEQSKPLDEIFDYVEFKRGGSNFQYTKTYSFYIHPALARATISGPLVSVTNILHVLVRCNDHVFEHNVPINIVPSSSETSGPLFSCFPCYKALVNQENHDVLGLDVQREDEKGSELINSITKRRLVYSSPLNNDSNLIREQSTCDSQKLITGSKQKNGSLKRNRQSIVAKLDKLMMEIKDIKDNDLLNSPPLSPLELNTADDDIHPMDTDQPLFAHEDMMPDCKENIDNLPSMTSPFGVYTPENHSPKKQGSRRMTGLSIQTQKLDRGSSIITRNHTIGSLPISSNTSSLSLHSKYSASVPTFSNSRLSASLFTGTHSQVKETGCLLSPVSPTTAIQYIVKKNYTKKMPEEMDLEVGDIVIVKKILKDGKAWGYNLSSQSNGSFCLKCLK